MKIDCLQYCNFSEKIFTQMREGGVDAVHVTIAYHENFYDTVQNIIGWNRLFAQYPHLIMQGRYAEDIITAQKTNRTAIFFGTQTPAPIEADIYLLEILFNLGVRFMQLTYNNQSLLAAGCYEEKDSGVTRMGAQVIAEMNRLGMVVDMSHSGEASTLDAIAISQRPIVISHANPAHWMPSRRNKSDAVIKALIAKGGMMGFSLYPHHLKDKSHCTVEDFCAMVQYAADLVGGIDGFGIGSDLCQDQPDSVVEWMRNGRWTKGVDLGEGSAAAPGFPPQPDWFKDNRDFHHIENGLAQAGFSDDEIAQLMGKNWYEFFATAFRPQR